MFILATFMYPSSPSLGYGDIPEHYECSGNVSYENYSYKKKLWILFNYTEQFTRKNSILKNAYLDVLIYYTLNRPFS